VLGFFQGAQRGVLGFLQGQMGVPGLFQGAGEDARLFLERTEGGAGFSSWKTGGCGGFFQEEWAGGAGFFRGGIAGGSADSQGREGRGRASALREKELPSGDKEGEEVCARLFCGRGR